MKTARQILSTSGKLSEDGRTMNNDVKKGGPKTPKIPALKFVDWYLSQLPR